MTADSDAATPSLFYFFLPHDRQCRLGGSLPDLWASSVEINRLPSRPASLFLLFSFLFCLLVNGYSTQFLVKPEPFFPSSSFPIYLSLVLTTASPLAPCVMPAKSMFKVVATYARPVTPTAKVFLLFLLLFLVIPSSPISHSIVSPLTTTQMCTVCPAPRFGRARTDPRTAYMRTCISDATSHEGNNCRNCRILAWLEDAVNSITTPRERGDRILGAYEVEWSY